VPFPFPFPPSRSHLALPPFPPYPPPPLQLSSACSRGHELGVGVRLRGRRRDGEGVRARQFPIHRRLSGKVPRVLLGVMTLARDEARARESSISRCNAWLLVRVMSKDGGLLSLRSVLLPILEMNPVIHSIFHPRPPHGIDDGAPERDSRAGAGSSPPSQRICCLAWPAAWRLAQAG
jgi:hypothetical protein